MKQFLRKTRFFLQLWQGFWAAPLAMLLFIAVGYLLQNIFTNPDDPQGGPGFYDPSFLQKVFYVTAIQVFMDFCIWIGIYFNFRGVWRFYVGKKQQDGTVRNESKEEFEKLLPWQKIAVLLFIYSLLGSQWLVLFGILR